jgi:hypothetical protein
MKHDPDPQVAPETPDVPTEQRRIRWSAPSAASNAHRPALTLISRGRARQKPVGLSWVGLIR